MYHGQVLELIAVAVTDNDIRFAGNRRQGNEVHVLSDGEGRYTTPVRSDGEVHEAVEPVCAQGDLGSRGVRTPPVDGGSFLAAHDGRVDGSIEGERRPSPCSFTGEVAADEDA